MKHVSIVLLALGCFLFAAETRVDADDRRRVQAGGIEFVFATVDEGREVLGSSDRFVERMSPFDRKVRLGTTEDPGSEGYLEFAAKQVREWSEPDRMAVAKAIESLDATLRPLKLPDLTTVMLVHTTGREESGAAYTRGPAIVVPKGKAGSLQKPPARLIAHELFHVLSRHDRHWRDPLYEVIGFQATSEIKLPISMADRRITNPDAPSIRHVIRVRLSDERQVYLAPVLYSQTDFDPRRPSLFAYLQFRLMEVTPIVGKLWTAVTKDGMPKLHEPNLPDFHRQIGGNTRYIIHPEEILADNFAAILTGAAVKDPWVTDAMKDLLRNTDATSE